jgi:hypothetical protein
VVVAVVVDGDVDVIALVIVAALVNGNAIVVVIDIVDDQGSLSLVSIATVRSSNSVPRAWCSGRAPVVRRSRRRSRPRYRSRSRGSARWRGAVARGVAVAGEAGASFLVTIRFQRPPDTPDTGISSIRRCLPSQWKGYETLRFPDSLHQATP